MFGRSHFVKVLFGASVVFVTYFRAVIRFGSRVKTFDSLKQGF